MAIRLEFKKEKQASSYKTIYIKNDIIDKIDQIAKDNDTSFNGVITNMVEYCINENLNT